MFTFTVNKNTAGFEKSFCKSVGEKMQKKSTQKICLLLIVRAGI